jgi:rubredoxin
MKKFICNLCGYCYLPREGDPESGESPDTIFDDLPEDWVCPMCSAEKENFEALEV